MMKCTTDGRFLLPEHHHQVALCLKISQGNDRRPQRVIKWAGAAMVCLLPSTHRILKKKKQFNLHAYNIYDDGLSLSNLSDHCAKSVTPLNASPFV